MRKLALLALMVAGCSSSGSGNTEGSTDPRIQMAGFNPAPPDANGFQIITPKVTAIPPGESVEYCTFTDMIADRDLDVKGTQAFQTNGGHHVVLFYALKPKPANTTHLCSDDDMTAVRFGIGGESRTYNELPGDLAVRIPKGAQIVAQHHYINTTDKPLDAQSAINVKLFDPNKTARKSASVVFVDSNLRVPAGKNSVDLHCTVNRTYKVWMMLPHMHAHGTHITVDHMPKEGEAKRLFDVNWEAEYEFHAPRIIKPENEAYQFHQGDKVKVHCEWDNDTGRELSFGQEMCLAFGQTIDDDGIGNVACDAGEWTDY
jgi:hypothetical protein